MSGLLNPDPLTYNTAQLDPGTNAIINNQANLAGQSTQQFANQTNQGVAQGAAQAQQSAPQANQEDLRQGYSNGSVNQAIRNQYNAQAGARVQQIQDANTQGAVFQKQAQTQQAFAMAMARQNVQTSTYENMMKAYNDTETARAQVLSSVLGGAGAAAGIYAGNRRNGRGRTQPNQSNVAMDQQETNYEENEPG